MHHYAKTVVTLTSLLLLSLTVFCLIGPEHAWPIALLQYVTPVLMAPALLAVAFAWKLGWQWRLASVCMLGWVVMFFLGLEWHWPTEPENRMRIMTYNVKEYLARKRVDGTLNVAYEVSRHDADVVVLQDAGGISDALDRSPPLRKLMLGDRQIFAFGQYLVASRYPLKDCAPGDISYRQKTHTYVRCTLIFHEREIDLFAVHFLTPREGLNAVRQSLLAGVEEWKQNFADRLTQAGRLAKDLRASARPIILAGDLNAPMRSVVISKLQDIGLRDAFTEAGRGFGNSYGHSLWPGISFMRIDHILFSSEFAASRSYVGGADGSAHRPVIADLSMP